MNSAEPKSRYQRQIAFSELGQDGQKRLSLSSAVLIGCGALGSAVADLLARAGIGSLHIVDRDFVEITNLQRQTLFDEQDVAEHLPKAEAAARKLRKINSGVEIEPVIADVRSDNVERLVRDSDLIIDGLDNFETRYLLNDAAVKLEMPWVYAGCIGAHGATMPILPGRTPCLQCLWPEAPAAGSVETCDSAGVLGPAVSAVASLQASTCMKLLSGRFSAADEVLTSIDVWAGRYQRVRLTGARESSTCRCCVARQFDYLSGANESMSSVLCGRNAVQISPAPGNRPPLDLARLSSALPARAKAVHNRFLVRFVADGCEITLFADGRAIVTGTADLAIARRIYAEYVGA